MKGLQGGRGIGADIGPKTVDARLDFLASIMTNHCLGAGNNLQVYSDMAFGGYPTACLPRAQFLQVPGRPTNCERHFATYIYSKIPIIIPHILST